MFERRRQRHRALARRSRRRDSRAGTTRTRCRRSCCCCRAVRRGEFLVELEEAGAVARDVAVDADLAEVGADLEGVRADELRVGCRWRSSTSSCDRVGLIAPSVCSRRLVVAADADTAGTSALRDLARGTSGEKPSVAGSKSMRQRVVVGEPRHAEAQRQHRAVAQHPGVVERQDLRPPLQDVVVRIGEPVRRRSGPRARSSSSTARRSGCTGRSRSATPCR